MVKRIAGLTVVMLMLLGLVAYSKWNPPPRRSSGFVEANEIRLGSRVGGRVANVFVEEGREVAKGDLLVELEPYDLRERQRELQLALAGREAELQKLVAGFREEERLQTKARLDQLQARLDLLRTGPRTQEIEAARSRVVLAKAQEQLAELTLDRVLKLKDDNAVAQQEVDQARGDRDVASATLVVRRQELDVLEMGTREEEIREAEARVEEARQAWQLMKNGYRSEEVAAAKAARDAAAAAVEAIGRQIEELTIRSPISGTIEALDLRPGDMVAPGAPVLSVLDGGELWVRAYVPQTGLAIQVGQTLPLSIDSYPDETFTGRVSFIARQAEFTPSNVQTPEERSKQVFRIKVTVEDPQDRLRPGMMADVWWDSVEAGK